MSGFQQFGFGENDTNIGNKDKRLKMDKGQSVRVSFLWWPGLKEGEPDIDAPSPTFAGGPRHYLKGVGYFINQGPEYTKIAGEPPKIRINTIIVKWPTLSNGKIDKAGIQNGDFRVLYWVFDENKYDEIKPLQNEWPFGKHDLVIKCTDAGYQKMSFSPCRESVLRMVLDKGPDNALVKKLVAAGQALLPTVNDEIGKLMSIDQIRDKIAGGGGGGGGGVGGGSPVDGGAVTEEIDEALDSLLDED